MAVTGNQSENERKGERERDEQTERNEQEVAKRVHSLRAAQDLSFFAVVQHIRRIRMARCLYTDMMVFSRQHEFVNLSLFS